MKSFFLLLSLISCFVLTACVTSAPSSGTRAAQLEFPGQKLKVDAYWVRPPALEAEQFLRLEVRDAASGELVPAPHEITVSVWNKTHSYGLVEPTVSPAIDASAKPLVGVYNVSGIYFLASGQWEVRVYVKAPGKSVPMQSFVVDLGEEKPNPMNDPKSPMHKMMNPSGGMDHSKHMEMMKEKSKAAPKTKPAE